MSAASRRPARRSSGAALLLAALAAWPVAAAAAGAPASGSAPALERFLSGRRDVVSLRARFVQEKHVALLEEPLVSRGRFSFRRGHGFRWEVEEPERFVVEVAGGVLRAGPPGELRAIEGGPAADLLAGLGGLLAGAEPAAGFDVRNTGRPDVLVLRPRDPRLARSIASIELELDRETGVPRGLRIREPNGDRTRIELGGVRVERAPGASPAS